MTTTICPYCRGPIESGKENQIVCSGCGTPHHADCYGENRGCTVFGCGCAPPDEPKLSVSTPEVMRAAAVSIAPPPPFGSIPPPPPPPGSSVAATLDFRKAKFPDAEIASPRAYAIGDKFVIPRDAVLPNRCLKCENAPTDPWLTKTFHWHHPALCFLLLQPLIYVIVALIVRKKIELALPLCDVHKSIRKRRLWIGWGLLLACIPLPSGLAASVENDTATGLAIILGFGMFLAGLVFIACSSPLRVTRIRSDSAEFKGASRDFLANLSRPAGIRFSDQCPFCGQIVKVAFSGSARVCPSCHEEWR